MTGSGVRINGVKDTYSDGIIRRLERGCSEVVKPAMPVLLGDEVGNSRNDYTFFSRVQAG